MTARLEKPLRRELEIRGRTYVVELSRAGVMFRIKGQRRRAVASIGRVLMLAETDSRVMLDRALERALDRGRR